jgi:hypothetical protein
MSLSQGIQGEDLQILPSEPGKTPGYVKDKIKRTKKECRLARARKEPWPPCLAKVIKKAISISELLTERDQAASLRVLREAKAATHRVYDPATKQLIEVPDHKTRLAAVTLELAYTEGRPIERQISVHGDVDDFEAMLEKARNSPAFMESLQNTVLGKEIAPTLPESQIGEHQ